MSAHSVSPDECLASLMRGEPCDAAALETHGVESLLAAAAAHDVVALVAESLIGDAIAPTHVRTRFREASQRLAAADLAAEFELRRLLNGLDAVGVQALLIKGSHLAYATYARPDLRARVDSDVLVARAQRDRAADVLRDFGYTAAAKVSGELTATQQLYTLRKNGVRIHLVDLHWRLSSPQAFAHVLTFEELFAGSRPVPSLTPSARGPSDVHALLIACMHRVAHHHDEPDRLKWFYDIHVIASGMSAAEWESFMALAAERGVAAVCAEGLQRAVRWLGTAVPSFVFADQRLAGGPLERTATYLQPRARARLVLDDLRVLPTWRERARLAREHLLPSRDYMRKVYAPDSGLPLPAMYVLRVIRGARAWLRSGADHAD